MNTIITALKEVYGLFVEDGSYAVAILLWLFIAAYALPYVGASLRAPLLLLGLLLILCENVLRSAKSLQ